MKGHGLLCGVLVAVSSCFVAPYSQARESGREEALNESQDEFSFSWLDPDKKVYVLQNRKYEKARHMLLSGMVGVGLSNPYRNSYTLDPRLGYYFTEEWGIEGFYTVYTNQENATSEALGNASPTALPVIREFRAQFGGLLHWAPWYAKINVFNKVLYFDWYFEGGVGNVRTELDVRRKVTERSVFLEQNFFALFLGTGHQYHLSQDFLVRLDFLGAFYRAQTFGNSGETTWFTNYSFNIGAGLRL